MKFNIFPLIIVSTAVALLLIVGGTSNAAVLLQTGFDGTSNNGTALSGIVYTTSTGLSGPTSLSGAYSLHATTDAIGYYAPDVQVNNSTWNVNIPLTVTGADVMVDNIFLDRQHFNVSGNYNTAGGKTYPIIATMIGSTSGQIGQVTLDPNPWPNPAATETFTFSSPLTLTNSENWTLNVQVNDEGGTNSGIYVGFDGFGVQGSVSAPPPPSNTTSTTLIGGTGPSYILNGSFESGSGTAIDNWGTGLNVGGEQRLDTLNATDGSYSMVVAQTLGGLINTNYDVQDGDTFDLSFDWRSAYNWDSADQIDWRLLTTSDDTTGGSVNVIASGMVTGFSDGTYRTESLMGIGTITAADLGHDLWLEFYSSNAGTEYARLDQVNLVVNSISIPEPSTFVLAALGLLGFAAFFRRRKR